MPTGQSSYLAIALLIAVSTGCGKATESTSAPDETKADVSKTEVTLKILDYDGIQELIASHKGKVVVMDCWSTFCGPCIQEFPKLVELHKKHGPEKLACVSLSFDYEGGVGTKPEDVQPDVLAFLEKQQATFDNILCREESDVLFRKMKLASIPAVYVYDREGNAKRFEGEGAYEEVPALVEKLLSN